MKELKSVNEILDFAMEREDESRKFYNELSKRMDRPEMKRVFADFAREESGHKKKLAAMKKGSRLAPSAWKVLDLKIADYIVDVKDDSKMNYQNALITAMKKEKKAFRMYSDLARCAKSTGVRDSFMALAQEEAKHKLRFEIEYDDNFQTEKGY